MPVETTYPGVYIEEIPSGSHTIAPVATSITAFLGRAPIGPTDEPTTIFNFGDYQRMFGGLSYNYPLSYAVRDFFANGGSQAVIVRLFEPNDLADDGVALVPFPASPPPLPTNTVLSDCVKAGATSVPMSVPATSEGEPTEGFQFSLGSDTKKYTVTDYQPPTSGTAGTVSFFPPLDDSFRICTPVTFYQGPDPGGWSLVTGSGTKIEIGGGDGLPMLGDQISIAVPGQEAPVKAIIQTAPTVKVGATPTAPTTVELQVAPKITAALIGGTPVEISGPPVPIPASGWQIDSVTKLGSTSATVTVVNGSGTPLVDQQFGVPGIDDATFQVVSWDPPPATPGKGQNCNPGPGTLVFEPIEGDQMPTDKTEFGFCSTLEWEETAPSGWVISKGPKAAGDTTMVLDGSNASGPIDVGYTFKINGTSPADDTIYTIRIYDPKSGQVSFLPKAKEAFSSSDQIVLSPPLMLEAANPGEWGNHLTATVDTNGITEKTAKNFAQFDLAYTDLFNLTLTYRNKAGKTVATERYLNVSVKTEGDAAAYGGLLSTTLKEKSNLARQAFNAMLPPSNGAVATGATLGTGNDGTWLSVTTYQGDQASKTGMYQLEKVPIFNLMCIPPDGRMISTVPENYWDVNPAVLNSAAFYCTERRAMLIADPPMSWYDKAKQGQISTIDPTSLGIAGETSSGIEVERNVAVYFPRVCMEDTLLKNTPVMDFPACGIIAGVMSATDVGRGIWKAPAGIDASMSGVSRLPLELTDMENGVLNQIGINCLRTFPLIGTVVWGARTLRGADVFEDDYKYVPVRRTTLFVEDSLMRGTQWAVFEPNTEALWSSLRLSAESFLAGLAQQGAFYDYKVVCDATTTTPTDIELGKVNMLVQIAPVDPAEFVVIQIQQTKPPAAG